MSKQQLLDWAQEQMNQGVPREVVCNQLLNMDKSRMSIDEMRAYADAERELFGVMVERNQRGQALERQGKVDDAIALYEQNVSDWFSGNHPYGRLRVIYAKRKQYDEAIRVCEAFINLADALLRYGSQRPDLRPKREKFAEWLAKLQGATAKFRSRLLSR